MKITRKSFATITQVILACFRTSFRLNWVECYPTLEKFLMGNIWVEIQLKRAWGELAKLVLVTLINLEKGGEKPAKNSVLCCDILSSSVGMLLGEEVSRSIFCNPQSVSDCVLPWHSPKDCRIQFYFSPCIWVTSTNSGVRCQFIIKAKFKKPVDPAARR